MGWGLGGVGGGWGRSRVGRVDGTATDEWGHEGCHGQALCGEWAWWAGIGALGGRGGRVE